MSVRMLSTILRIRGFLCPVPMISSELTIGTPDFIMIAIWRLKKAMSLVLIALPAAPNRGLGLGLTTLGVMPWRRSSARSRLAFLAGVSPFILTPRLSVPTQTNGCSSMVLRTTGSFLIALRLTDIFWLPSHTIPRRAISRHGSRFLGRWAVLPGAPKRSACRTGCVKR